MSRPPSFSVGHLLSYGLLILLLLSTTFLWLIQLERSARLQYELDWARRKQADQVVALANCRAVIEHANASARH